MSTPSIGLGGANFFPGGVAPQPVPYQSPVNPVNPYAGLGTALGGVGSVLSHAAGGAAAGNQQQANSTLQQNQQALQAAQQQFQNGITSGQFAMSQSQLEQSQFMQNLRNALEGGLLQGTQDATISGLPPGVTVPNIQGGLRPSAITGAAGIGQNLQQSALMNLLGGNTPVSGTPTAGTGAPFTGFNAPQYWGPSPPAYQAPQLQPMPQASGWQQAASDAGTGISLLGSLLPLLAL